MRWGPVDGAARYRIARWASAWTPIASGTATTATIPWRTGISEYGVFAVMPTGEAQLVDRFRTSR